MLLRVLVVALVGLLLMVLAGFLFGARLEQPYLRYANLPFPVLAPAYPGQPVLLEVERCNLSQRAKLYQVAHQLRNIETGAELLLPGFWVQLQPGCTRAVSRLHLVPPDTLPGTYVLTGSALVEGQFGNHRVFWQSRPFEVMPPKESL